VAGGKVFRFPNLPPMANTPIENFRSGFLNCLQHWQGVHHFPWCFYGNDNNFRTFEVVLDCGLNLQKGHLSYEAAKLLRPILEDWTEKFVAAYAVDPFVTLWMPVNQTNK
jgi:hypothetical protein